MDHQRPPIQFAGPSSERTIIDPAPWHQAPPPAPPQARPPVPEPAPPSLPALVTDSPEPDPSERPRLRADWPALGATAVFVALSCFVIGTMNDQYARPAAAAAAHVRETRVKGYTPAHDPALRPRAHEIAPR